MTSLPDAIAQQRLELAASLEPLGAQDRAAMISGAVVDFGGTLVPADAGGRWGTHLSELDLLGLSHMGNTTEECIANWIKSAMRCALYEDAA